MTKNKDFIYYLTIFVSIICAIITYKLSTSISDGYKLIFLIPTVYSLMFILSKNNKKIYTNLGILILNIVMFIRYLIYPLVIVLTFKTGTFIGISQYINTSIYLMIYECIAVFLIINWWGVKRLLKTNNNFKLELSFHSTINIIFLLTLVISFLSALLNPSLLGKYNLFGSGSIQNVNVGGFMSVFFKIGVYIVFILILRYLYRLHNKTNTIFPLILTIILSLFFIASEANLSSGNVSRWNFLLFSISILLIISKLYSKYANLILGLSIPTIFVFIIILTIIKFDDSFTLQTFFLNYFSIFSLDYYFMGIENISHGLAMSQVFEHEITIKTMFTDIFSSAPLISNLFDPLNNSTPVFYHDFNGRTDTIIPTVAQSYSYFGFIGAPFMSILFTFLTIESNRMLNTSNDVIMFFTLSQLTILFALFMAINTNIIFENAWHRIIFVILIFLNKKYTLFSTKTI
jgi:hypothetical protein